MKVRRISIPRPALRVAKKSIVAVIPGPTSGFSYYRDLTVDHTQCGSADSTDFPVLVSFTDATLKTVANGGHVQDSGGADILFYSDSSGSTQIASEIEFYDGSSGTLIAWVKVGTLSHTSDTVFYVFYGNASPPSRTTNPWDTYFKAVWHWPNGTTLSLADSTTNGNDGTNSGATAATGEIDGGVHFASASSQHIDADGVAGDIETGDVTFSTWLNFDSNYGSGSPSMTFMALNDDAVSGGNDIGLRGNDYAGAPGNIKLYINQFLSGDEKETFTTETSWTGGVWYYIAGVVSATSIQIYVNGVASGTPTATSGRGATPVSAFRVGGVVNPSGDYFDGTLDETRVAGAARSASWLLSEYNNQKASSTFLALGAETPIGNTTTTQTVTGVARVQTTASQTNTGVARVQGTATETQDGTARVTATTDQTQNGVADIQATTTETQNGVARLQTTSDQTQAGVGRIETVADQIQNGLARITTSVDQTQDGTARVQATADQTQDGIASIQATSTQTQDGVAKIAAPGTTTQNQPGIAAIQNTTAQPQPGLARIETTAIETQAGVARIQVPADQTQDGLARITTSTDQLQLGIARITASNGRTQAGVSRITTAADHTQDGVASISEGNTAAQTGLARITSTLDVLQLGRAAIQATTTRTQTGVARIQGPTPFTAPLHVAVSFAGYSASASPISPTGSATATSPRVVVS
jgi:Concanavalin A-like lectin/glucanases superfamily